MKVFQAQVVRFSKFGLDIDKGELHTEYEKAENDMQDMLDSNSIFFPNDDQKGIVATIYID